MAYIAETDKELTDREQSLTFKEVTNSFILHFNNTNYWGEVDNFATKSLNILLWRPS